ncbi:MAG: hypothetical protein WCJ24_03275 [Candidatus Saccharibacteria bacterium]
MFGNVFIGIMGLFLWVFLALWPAMIARRKGYSFVLFFILAIFISWPIALIITFFIKDKTQTAQSRADDKAVDAKLRREEKL